ncbi:MAG: IPT/TIG domain-containing protein [Bacteroidota bacterium]
MKTLKQNVEATLLITGVLLLFAASCSKNSQTYKADDTNPYANPNPPKMLDNPMPVINGFAPTKGLPNTVVTIAGMNFDQVIANNTATINGVAATVNAVTAISMTITIPPGATTGPIVVKSGSATVTSLSNFTVTTGTVSMFYDLGANYMEHIAVDKDGNVYGDDGAKTIYKIVKDGQLSVYAGGPGTSTFKSLWGVVVNSNLGDVYTTDRGSFSIIRITPAGIIAPFAGNGVLGYVDDQGNAARFVAPTQLAIGADGSLYVNDTHRVRKITTAGVVTTLAGGNDDGFADGKGAEARFGALEGIAVDIADNVYVSDTKYLRIRKITKDGVVTTLAGSGAKGFVDGPGTTAQFYYPGALAVDPISGNLFITDQNSLAPLFEIRMINKLGVVTTLLKGTSNTGVVNGPTATATTNAPDGIAFDVNGNMSIVNTGAKIISKVTFQ